MVGAAVHEFDVELQQPDAEPCPRPVRPVAPRRAVVDQQRARKPVTPEHRFEARLHALPALVRARRQAQQVARVVVDRRQRMAALPVAQHHPALEVHLPHQVRRGMLEAAGCPARSLRVRHDPAVPHQNRMDRRCRRNGQSFAPQTRRDLARTPRRMRVADRQDRRFRRSFQPARTAMRPARAVLRPVRAARPRARQPLVAGLRADPEPSAQIPPLRTRHLCQRHELLALRHPRRLPPGHRLTLHGCAVDLSTMSPNGCQLSLRAEHLTRASTGEPPALDDQAADARVKPGHDVQDIDRQCVSSVVALVGRAH